ncbi:hypothetical protein CRE_01407 [Caenorhabditis remanei]|uniref:Tc1-like transposase DDE domain-containing protein n=1 Tax=Caenorhabditis remanei TaxID=31234 RepID=E3NJ63_CAERE|nr:hypothetical protein CRE_01407 [Caenorhabditis remanei]
MPNLFTQVIHIEMVRSTRLSLEQQAQIDLMVELGLHFSEMSRRIGRSRDCIRRYVNDPLAYGTAKSPGRPRILNQREERAVVRCASNTVKSANDVIAELDLKASKSTVLRTFHRSGHLKRAVLKPVPKMTDAHKLKRLAFAKSNMAQDWSKIVWSDEKKFNLDGPDGAHSYWRDLRKDPMTFSRRNFGGGSLMVWGAFCNNKAVALKFVTCKMNSVDYQATLQSGIVPFFSRGNRKKTHIFQQDNAAIHKSGATMNWFATKKIKTLDWPANSPDLNPIENVWGLLARAVYRHGKQFQTVSDLKDTILDEWNKLQPSYLQSLTDSMSNRLCQVIQNFGGSTTY